MTLYYEDKDMKLYHGKMQDILDTLPENSIDSCVCDPPYELAFMNKGWDNSGVAFDKESWKKVLRVLKPGAYLLAFGGTRTFHRIACAIEDVGFEIRDCIMWLYGSGFPKSHNIGLDIDKLNGYSDRGHRIAVANRNHPDGTLEPNGEQLEPYEAKTEDGKKWSGWGTALKPAYEPIIVARKPIEDTVAKNCLKYGVGGININECRVMSDDLESCFRKPTIYNDESEIQFNGSKIRGSVNDDYLLGRFPANVITDGSDEVKAGFPDTKSEGGCSMKNSMFGLSQQKDDYNFHDSGSVMRFFYTAKASKKDRDEGLDQFEEKNMRLEQNRKIHSAGCEYIENGKLKQNPHLQSSIKRNIHPTVKPVELMQYLVRLVSPKGSTILDCFMGSGSTGKAVMFENRERESDYKFIGCEMTDEYLPIAKSRIIYGRDKFEYDFKKELEEKKKEGQLNIFDIMEEN